MRIAILGGGGAMGGLFGGYLARAGNDVTLIDVSKAPFEAINDNGLTIEEKDGSPAGDPRAGQRPIRASVGPVDLIINFVKCYHTEAAIKAAAPMIGADTAVLSLQNGWGNAPRIASIVGEDRVLVGLTYHSGTLLGAGQGQASRLRHDLYRRARRQADRAPRNASPRPSAAPRFETTVSRQDPRRGLEEARAQRLHAADRRRCCVSSRMSWSPSSRRSSRWRRS